MWLVSYPNPSKMEQSWNALFETLYQYDDKLCTKKFFSLDFRDTKLAKSADLTH